MIHVIPVGDGEPIHEAGPDCWCKSTELPDGITAHNAKDGREKYERQGYSHPEKKWVLVGERKTGA